MYWQIKKSKYLLKIFFVQFFKRMTNMHVGTVNLFSLMQKLFENL